jgi:hypothetical protein
MPIHGPRELAQRLERAILEQRPAARADVALFTGEQLAHASPVRLASTAAMNNEVLALEAAKAMQADLLVHGEILSADIDLSQPETQQANVNWNEAFFQHRDSRQQDKRESLLLSWRIIDRHTRKTVGTSSFMLRTKEAEKQYPDLDMQYPDDKTSMLIVASARETWKLLSPTVTKERVKLAVPWLQPGAWQVRRGVSAAKKGDWPLAEQRFRRAAERFHFNAAAHHNLSLALAAQEDFPSAKQELFKATGPLAWGLPHNTLFWLDGKHRRYHQAHGIPAPIDGWAFPEPADDIELIDAPPIDLADLPWWTAIPFADFVADKISDDHPSK